MKPGADAMASATPRVPLANAAFSKRPIGPFQNTALALRMGSAKRSTLDGPTSRAMSSAPTSSTETTRPLALSVPAATTTSEGRSSETPRSSARVRMVRASASLSSSTRLLPIERPCAARKVFAMAPPMTSVSTRARSASRTAILSETFAPPSTAT